MGRVWRHVPVGAAPLHIGYILKAKRGRWNTQRPRLPCLYTALSAEDAIAEYEKHIEQFGATGVRDLVSIDIVVGPVLDLTKSAIRKKVASMKRR